MNEWSIQVVAAHYKTRVILIVLQKANTETITPKQ